MKHGDDDIAIQPPALAALSLRGTDKVRHPIAPIARRLSDRMAFRSHRFSFPSCSVENSHVSSIVRSMGRIMAQVGNIAATASKHATSTL